MSGNIVAIIYIVGVLIGWCWCAFEYGRATEEERESNGFVFVPFSFLVWPFAIPMIPVMLLIRLFQWFGEKHQESSNEK